MSEYRKQIAIGSALAIILALGLGLGIVYLPSHEGATSSSSVTSTSVRAGSGGTTLITLGTSYTTIGTTLPSSVPAALEGYVSTHNVSCSLSTGVCSLTIVYNGTDPLQLEGCQFAIANSTGGMSLVNGTIGGAATAGIPSNSQVSATCSIPTSELAHQTKGSTASGSFIVKLVDSWYSFPAGTEAGFGFEGTWS